MNSLIIPMDRLIRNLSSWWSTVRPRAEAKRGALIAVIICGLVGAVLTVDLGLPRWLDLLVAIGFSAVTMALCGVISRLLLWIICRRPYGLPGFIVGVAWIWSRAFMLTTSPLLFGFIVVVPQALLGAGLGILLLSRLRSAPLARKAIAAGFLVLALALDLVLVAHILSKGEEYKSQKYGQEAAKIPVQIADPSQRGPYIVHTLIYGSGSDKRRLEFGPSVGLRTPSIDGSRLLYREPLLRGLSGDYRRWYWGFDSTTLPINGRVWYPSGDGPFPLVMIVHGGASMMTPSDTGYDYLGELLASRGFIVVSVDENFLNHSVTGVMTGEMAARGWLLLEHLKMWREWNRQVGNPFNGRVDLSRVALMGHSRGGDAVATAALLNTQTYWSDDANLAFDYGFGIRALVGISPDDAYAPGGILNRKTLSGVDYLLLQGGQDAQLRGFLGSRQYNRILVGKDNFKAEFYIDRANHVQFNTAWGRADWSGPMSWLLADRPVIAGEAQRRIASIFISAFLEASLHGRREYLAVLQDPRAGHAWLPDTTIRHRYQDGSYRLIAGFEEDTNIITTTIPGGRIKTQGLASWREGLVLLRRWGWTRQDNAVYLRATQNGGSFTVIMPEDGATDLKITEASSLQLSMALTASVPAVRCDPSFELTDEGGLTATLPLSRFGTLLPPPGAPYYKWRYLDASMGHAPTEVVLQTYTLPLSDFIASNPAFQPSRLQSIRLYLDDCIGCEVLVDEIGFSE